MDARNGKTDARSERTSHKGKMQVFDDACSIQTHIREGISCLSGKTMQNTPAVFRKIAN